MLEAEYFPTTTNARPNMPSSNHLAERTPLVVTPIPFTTPWFRDVFHEGAAPEHRPKRLRLNENNSTVGNQQMDCEDKEGTGESWWPENRLKSDPQQVPVLAKLYYELYGDQTEESPLNKLRLNDIVEMVGILEQEDKADVADDDAVMEMGSTWEEVAPVPVQVPRLHVLWFASVDLDKVSSSSSNPNANMAGNNNSADATAALAKALSIPEAPAAAVWMTLLSMAEREKLADSDSWAPVQTPNETALGCSSLGMVLSSPDACAAFQTALYSVLSQVTPVVHSLDVSNEKLADLRAPWRENGRLTPTPLQLPKGATLIVNVSGVHPGRLSPEHLETMQALQQLATGHKIGYRFEGGMKIDFEADLRIIVLSTPVSKALLPCTLQVKCDYAVTAQPSVNTSELSALRDALGMLRGGVQTAIRPHCNIGLSAAVLDKAQKDFIERRAIARNNSLPAVTERDFHRWLTLTRLQTRSRKAAVAEAEDWNAALTLDDAMVASLQ